MKPILMFTMASCPYCVRARAFMQEIISANPAYKDITLEIIDEKEHPDVAEAYVYYYVPTFYVGGRKAFEGAATRQDIENVFAQAAR